MENYARMGGNDGGCRLEVSMKKAVLALTVLALLFWTAGNLKAQNAEDAKFKKFEDTFWDSYFRFFPTAGTLEGYTKYDDKIEDLSTGSVEKFLGILDGAKQDLITKIDRTKLSPDLQIAHGMYLDVIDLQILKLENSLFIIDNPLVYNKLIVDSIRSLIVRNPASPAAAARARQLPGLIKRAKDTMKSPPQEYTQTAIDRMPAIIDFYKVEVPKLAASAPGLDAETGKIVAALEDYQKFLQNELLPKSTGNFRAGDAHLKILRLMSQGTLPIIEEIAQARSKADIYNIRREMFLVSAPFFKIMYPNIDIEQLGKTKGQEGTWQTVIQGVLDKVRSEHPDKDQYVPEISAAAAAIKSFIQQNKVLDLPDENLQVEAMPPYLAETGWFDLAGPGAFDTAGGYTSYVRPVPADWPPDRVTSFLEEHNNYYNDWMTIQRVFPGPFVPTFSTRKSPSVIERIAANQSLIKGWPLYLEDLLVESGYRNYDLRSRLNELKLLLKIVIDFQMDIDVHEGTYTKDKVVDYMTRTGYMTAAEAEGHWNQIVLNPGEASLAYIGYQEILDMEKDYRKLKGDAFTPRDFLAKLLSFGGIPLRELKTKLTQ